MITVDLGGTTRMIRRDDVTYVQAQGDYARLHTADASYLIRVPLADLEQQWAEAGFLRIHRSYLIALNHVSHHEARRGPAQRHRGRGRPAHQPPAPARRTGEARGHPDQAAGMTRVRVTAPRGASTGAHPAHAGVNIPGSGGGIRRRPGVRPLPDPVPAAAGPGGGRRVPADPACLPAAAGLGSRAGRVPRLPACLSTGSCWARESTP